jgi:hypothetical protein
VIVISAQMDDVCLPTPVVRAALVRYGFVDGRESAKTA